MRVPSTSKYSKWNKMMYSFFKIRTMVLSNKAKKIKNMDSDLLIRVSSKSYYCDGLTNGELCFHLWMFLSPDALLLIRGLTELQSSSHHSLNKLTIEINHGIYSTLITAQSVNLCHTLTSVALHCVLYYFLCLLDHGAFHFWTFFYMYFNFEILP